MEKSAHEASTVLNYVTKYSCFMVKLFNIMTSPCSLISV